MSRIAIPSVKEQMDRADRIKATVALLSQAPLAGETGPNHPVRCRLCDKVSEITECEITNPTMPNTLTGLKDHNTALWKCPHCEGWN
jgi:hypothetical protein